MSVIGTAGSSGKGDVEVTIEPLDSAKGPEAAMEIEVTSPVRNLFGESQNRAIADALDAAGIGPARVTVQDNHALDWVLRARILAAAGRMDR